ncbi:hypothetical protein G1C97_0506 [Bifidobacterium sp. DSM 109959]|uniref:Uncharacterized protein n=1 Tax=Bifidobacterium olomucense TaxID=2675324 RepID=A0A7Y0EWA6_9BIFI|nr:hypothetical protein [Bifidobacterium sp. DSM 109959]
MRRDGAGAGVDAGACSSVVEFGSVVALSERNVLIRAGVPESDWPVGMAGSTAIVDARLVVMAAMPRVMGSVMRDAPSTMLRAGDDGDDAECLRLFMKECVRRLAAPMMEALTPGLDGDHCETRFDAAVSAMEELDWGVEYLTAEGILDPEAPMDVDDGAWADWVVPLRVAVSALASTIAAAGSITSNGVTGDDGADDDGAGDDAVPGESSMRLAARLCLYVDATRAGDCLSDISAGLISAEAWPGAESASMTFDEVVRSQLHYADVLYRMDDHGGAPAPGSPELRRTINAARLGYEEAMSEARYADAIRIITDLPHAQGASVQIDDWLAGSGPTPPLSVDDVETDILRGAYPYQQHEEIVGKCREAIAELEQCGIDAALLAGFLTGTTTGTTTARSAWTTEAHNPRSGNR